MNIYNMDIVMLGLVGDRNEHVLSAIVFDHDGTDEDGDYHATVLAAEIVKRSADEVFDCLMPALLNEFFPGGLQRKLVLPCLVYYELDATGLFVTGYHVLSDEGIRRMKAVAVSP